MHLCFITNEYPEPGKPHGGVGTFVQTLGKALVQKGCAVTVLGIGGNVGEQDDMGVHVIRIAESLWPRFRFIDQYRRLNRALRKFHRACKIDVVETPEAGLAFIQKLPGIQYVVRMHGGHHFFAAAEKRGIQWWKGFQEKRSFQKADHLVGVSHYVMQQTLKHLPFPHKTGPVLYNPANLERFYPADPAKIVPCSILFAATVCEKKGIRQLVQAFPAIKKALPATQLFIAGRDSMLDKGRGSYVQYLKSFIDASVADSVHFLGVIDNHQMPAQIEAAELCIYPSHMEAMPLAWIEVLCMGKTLIGSKTGPGTEVIEHGKTGMLCNPLDTQEIAEQAIFLLQHPEVSREMGRQARIDVLNRFDVRKIVEQNLDFYRKITEKP